MILFSYTPLWSFVLMMTLFLKAVVHDAKVGNSHDSQKQYTLKKWYEIYREANKEMILKIVDNKLKK